MSDFAAGHFAKADLQQVYVGICSGSMYVSVSRFGSYRPRYKSVRFARAIVALISNEDTTHLHVDICNVA